MAHLEDVSVVDLQNALETVEGKAPAVRLSAAIAYKNGVSQTEIAGWFNVQRKTVYNWLRRFDNRDSLSEAATDRPRSGRDGKLTEDQRARFERALQRPPTVWGYEGAEWTQERVQRHLKEQFGVEYSLASCRRFLAEAGGE